MHRVGILLPVDGESAVARAVAGSCARCLWADPLIDSVKWVPCPAVKRSDDSTAPSCYSPLPPASVHAAHWSKWM